MKPIITIFALIIIAAIAVIIIAKFVNNKNSAPQGGNTVIDIPEKKESKIKALFGSIASKFNHSSISEYSAPGSQQGGSQQSGAGRNGSKAETDGNSAKQGDGFSTVPITKKSAQPQDKN